MTSPSHLYSVRALTVRTVAVSARARFIIIPVHGHESRHTFNMRVPFYPHKNLCCRSLYLRSISVPITHSSSSTPECVVNECLIGQIRTMVRRFKIVRRAFYTVTFVTRKKPYIYKLKIFISRVF